MDKLGIYVHIPFCAAKCKYCDFFSKSGNEDEISRYISAVNERLAEYGRVLNRTADTLYIGGGTPGLIGADRLSSIADTAKSVFSLDNAEFTAELNPASAGDDFDFEKLRRSGFNRLSIGMQSANNNELRRLGRLHTAEDVKATVSRARVAGFKNISLDLMLCIPEQTKESLNRSIEYCARLDVEHISAYILKIEEGTPFYKEKNTLTLDEDIQAEFYLFACERLEQLGYYQYEISNFSKPKMESRHNLKYWNCDEYLGIGCAAHSFLNGKRFYTDRSFEEFYNEITHQDGDGGSVEEYIMLRLRLTEGLTYNLFKERFGFELPKKYIVKAEKLSKTNFLICDNKGIRLTKEGFLISNTLILEILS